MNTKRLIPEWVLGTLAAASIATASCSAGLPVEPSAFEPVTDGRGQETIWWERAEVVFEDPSPDPGSELVDRWVRVRIPTQVLFEFDSDALGVKGEAELIRLVEILGLREARDILVAGGTDSVGTLDYNRQLSGRRAKSAVATLVNAGVDGGVIRIEAWADERPVSVPHGLDTQAADALQRRLEIHALVPGGPKEGTSRTFFVDPMNEERTTNHE